MKRISWRDFGLTFLFAFVVFCSLSVSLWISLGLVYLLVRLGIVKMAWEMDTNAWHMIVILAAVSLPVGIAVAAVASKVPLKPVRNLIDSMDKLASGDFKTRVSVGPVMKNYPTFVQVSESFNKMAQELENTEMLRSDFINNFSHEFKTPIVSIAGFAKLLKRGSLTAQEQQEYLDIIEKESSRLADMATNVLNLTKVENQSILTDVSTFNLSEQLRSCLLLLERKWVKKDIEFDLQFDEFDIEANEELLKEVWINLIDNAIKFSPRDGEIRVTITQAGERLQVAVTNFGSEIPEESQKKIWNKFYQADESHASEGNGIGLAVVRQVVQLHKGSVGVSSTGGVTTFTVQLPQKQ